METTERKTVQRYIDETPFWADGTPLSHAPMTGMQWRIWAVSAAGKFFEGGIIFMTGVALPLIVKTYSLTSVEAGLVASTPLLGILVGATGFGRLADLLGRRFVFITDMVVLVAFLVLMIVAPNFSIVLLALFGIGIALGGDYPTAHLVISECIAARHRGRMVLAAFSFQALGALVGTIASYLVLSGDETTQVWRLMYATVLVPALLILIGRLFIIESPFWLIAHHKTVEAEFALYRLMKRTPQYPRKIALKPHMKQRHAHSLGLLELLRSPERRRELAFTSVPWFFQDIATYGIGLSMPLLFLEVLGESSGPARNVVGHLAQNVMSARITAVLDVFLVLGVVCAVLLADRVRRIPLQIWGFVGCAVGLVIACVGVISDGVVGFSMLFAGLMVFNFMCNVGPNAQTYLLAGEVFPTRLRASGAGLAASCGKVGAVGSAFLFPTVLLALGLELFLLLLVATSLLGAFFTWVWRIETTNRTFQEIDQAADKAED
ncbi:Major myo-inositol transporter IolT [Pseudovibrio axinellae]|uniref:Major myo-inositol transporter IolT n=1 Tax=Pseudovibrio axinellae TaxID=989403 RepID=A0A166ATY7_9HYPH|nr:MFS transporter [Pseudovibrio axinellae]KZL21547.1 Major myo-inositol transporter IolT [Pseudovibrio axinellae]SER09120.1 Sugar transporter [Pseudovibrio axinellae]